MREENSADTLFAGALQRLQELMVEARSRGVHDIDAAALATAGDAGPSVRMVNVLAVEEAGLLFFANVNSGKARQLESNPRAALCFYWPSLGEQVVVEGPVLQQSEEESDRYWHRRVRESQLVAWASRQSEFAVNRGQTRERMKEGRKAFGFEHVPRHADWRAYRLQPERIEFWPAGWARAHERIRYVRDDSGKWTQQWLQP